MVPELRGMELNLSILDYRRKRYNIIQVFKIISDPVYVYLDDIDMNKFFTFTNNSQLRRHYLKLNKPRVNESIRLNSFAMRTIPVWNNLPSEIVNSKTLLEFKTKLDKLWKNSRYCLFVCFVALRPKSTAMVMAGWSVDLTTLFQDMTYQKFTNFIYVSQ